MVLLLLQAHTLVQGTAKHTHYVILRGGVGIGAGGLEKFDIPLIDFAEELPALARSATLVPYH